MAEPIKRRTVNENSNFKGNDDKSESSDESSDSGGMEEHTVEEV